MVVEKRGRQGARRLGHGWRLIAGRGVAEDLISAFIRPAVRCVPPRMARQLGFCRVSLVDSLGGRGVTSKWKATEAALEIHLAARLQPGHDVALELLLCLGQALWTKLTGEQRRAYWLLVDDEISLGIAGEIDQDALEQKRLLLAARGAAISRKRLERFGAASFAGSAAEYVHCLWHDVTVRMGPDFLPPRQLRRRLELLSRWYPPAPGRRLFPRPRPAPG